MDDRQNWKNEDTNKLFEAMLTLYSVEECERFFRDLMTIPEIGVFAQRFKVAFMLSKGLSYRQISKETGVSTTTITRINDWLERGCDGYKLAISRLDSKDNNEAPRIHHHEPQVIAGL